MRDQNKILHIIKYKRCILNTHSLFAYFFLLALEVMILLRLSQHYPVSQKPPVLNCSAHKHH